ncbi:MAG: hypothetical protein ACOVOI_23850 [Hyphomicrobiales bacterium]|jgi:hypothetical protein
MISIKDRRIDTINRSLTIRVMAVTAFTERKGRTGFARRTHAGVTTMLRRASRSLLVLALLATTPVAAHRLPDSGVIIGRPGLDMVLRSLEARGFYDLGPARALRGAYRLTATEPRGQRVIVTVHARTGHILDIRATHWTPAPARSGEPVIFQPER